MKLYRVVCLFILSCCVIVLPSQADPLEGLRSEHPRLLATADDFDRIRELVRTDPVAKQWHAKLKDEAAAMLDAPVVQYELLDGRRLLYVSRQVADRVMTLGLLDTLEPNDTYRDRIWADLQAAADFKHWNPDHFLDVAEMAFAFGLAYDWLYDRWTEEQRKTLRTAIVKHALDPAFDAYERRVWWTRTHINWSQVCNGGLLTAALAIAEDEPQHAARMIELGVEALKKPMARYAPDGGYEEGPGYWHYGTLYNVVALAVMETALGHDFGLGKTPGFSATGGFPKHMTGPTGNTYNFGDNRAKPVCSPAKLYLAKRFDQPGLAHAAVRCRKGSAFDLLWYDPAAVAPDAQDPALAAIFQSAGAASMRSSWHDPDAWFVAAKGGWIGFGHSQMDLGSFVLERQGVRWLIDLGSDNYNLPGYFHSDKGSGRWRYYRNRAEGHNTLVINPGQAGGQDYDATAPITLDPNTITIDLSQAYGGKATRTITLDPERDLTRVSDVVAFDDPSEVWWFAHTRAKIEIDEAGRSALLKQDGKAMRVTIESPADAVFSAMPARPLKVSPDPPGQNPNNGARLVNTAPNSRFTKRGETPRFGEPDPDLAIRKLVIQLADVTQTRITVRFEPAE